MFSLGCLEGAWGVPGSQVLYFQNSFSLGNDITRRLPPPGGTARGWGGNRSQEGPRYRVGCRKLKMGTRALEKLAILQKHRGLFQVTPSACSCHQGQNLLKGLPCSGHLWKPEAPAYAAPPVQPTRPSLRRRCCPPAATVGRARCVHA